MYPVSLKSLHPKRAARLFGALLPICAMALSAQPRQSAERVRLVVHVVNESSVPIEGAEVTFKREKHRDMVARTDSAGVVRFDDLTAGVWHASVRRIGMQSFATSIDVEAGAIEFTLLAQGAGTVLPEVRTIGERAVASRLSGFERRRAAGVPNAVVTREQIEQRGPIVLSRMLRGLAGLKIADSLGSIVAVSSRGAKPTKAPGGFAMVQCVLRISVDGILMPALTNIDQIVPKDVHGIEIYFGPSRMPPELGGLRTDNWCGLIAIWTRDR